MGLPTGEDVGDSPIFSWGAACGEHEPNAIGLHGDALSGLREAPRGGPRPSRRYAVHALYGLHPGIRGAGPQPRFGPVVSLAMALEPRYREGTYHRQRLCQVEGCDRKHQALGLCKMHYARYRRHGRITRLLPLERPVCSILSCERQAVARGWCKMHWTRWRRTGDAQGTLQGGRKPRSSAWTFRLAPPISEAWVTEAHCSAQPHLFDTLAQADAAKLVCDTCPVRLPCLRFALANRIDQGIRGGFTPAERRVIAELAS